MKEVSIFPGPSSGTRSREHTFSLSSSDTSFFSAAAVCPTQTYFLNFLAGSLASNISSISSRVRPFVSGRKKNTQRAATTHDGNQMYPYRGPQLSEAGLIKYGAVKVVSQAKKKPAAAA